VSGYSAICVPGAIAGFASALQKYGTLSWAEALQPAIHHAALGLDLDWFTCLTLAIDAAGLAQDPASAALFLDAGRAPRASDRTPAARRPMPDKARLLQRLAEAGPREFYEGETARALARDLEVGGSALRFADLANYQPIWQPPLVGHYRGQQILAMAGLSGGPTLLASCDRLTASDLGPSSSSAEAALIHATAIRAAYEQRLTTMGHAATAEAGCTSHISVVDASGSMVSLTNTLITASKLATFDLDGYSDQYVTRLKKLIALKVDGRRLHELARRYQLQKNHGGEMDFVVVDLDLGGTRRSMLSTDW
jgi:gamma-glutamyltranspeptidase/glutathione hydrolase